MNYDWAVSMCRNHGLKCDYWPHFQAFTFTEGKTMKVTTHLNSKDQHGTNN